MPIFGRLKNLLGVGKDASDSASVAGSSRRPSECGSVVSMAGSVASRTEKMRRFSINLLNLSPGRSKPKAAVAARNRRLPESVRQDVDPFSLWDEIGELGDGAFGKVKKVVSRTDHGRLAAAKVITLEEEDDIQDFIVEIDILCSCAHPNIVGLQEAFLYHNALWILLEFCGGGAVDQIMLELDKPLTEPQIKHLAHEVCKALVFLHGQHVIHRDLKAGNILLTSDGDVKLADFGVSAKMASAHSRRDSFIGTPYWMAPEVMVCETFKDSPYDTRSDVWSLGITLIECAQMEPPNSEMNPMRVLLKVQKSPPPTLEKPNRWSRLFSEFLARCLVKEPSGRVPVAETLRHPWLADAGDKRPLLELLAEMGAEVLMEEVDEEPDSHSRLTLDSEPAGEEEERPEDPEDSLGLSDISGGQNGSLPIDDPPPPVVVANGTTRRDPADALPAPPVPSHRQEAPSEPGKKKKRAPPPPTLPVEPLEENAATSVDELMDAVTPGAKAEAEAIGVLDDLYATLRADDDEAFPEPPSPITAKPLPLQRPSTSSAGSESLGPPTPVKEPATPTVEKVIGEMVTSVSSLPSPEWEDEPDAGRKASTGSRHQLILNTETAPTAGFSTVSELTDQERNTSLIHVDTLPEPAPPKTNGVHAHGEWSSVSESVPEPPQQTSPGVRAIKALHEAQISDPGTPRRPKSNASSLERRTSNGSGPRWEAQFGGRASEVTPHKDSGVDIPTGLIARNKELIRAQQARFNSPEPKPKPPPPPPKSGAKLPSPPSTLSSSDSGQSADVGRNRRSVAEMARIMDVPADPVADVRLRHASPGPVEHRRSANSIREKAELVQRALAESAKRHSGSPSPDTIPPQPAGDSPVPPSSSHYPSSSTDSTEARPSGYNRMEEMVYFGDFSHASSSSSHSPQPPRPASRDRGPIMAYGPAHNGVGYYSSEAREASEAAGWVGVGEATSLERRGRQAPAPPARVSSRPPSRDSQPRVHAGASQQDMYYRPSKYYQLTGWERNSPSPLTSASSSSGGGGPIPIPPPEPPIDYDHSPRASAVKEPPVAPTTHASRAVSDGRGSRGSRESGSSARASPHPEDYSNHGRSDSGSSAAQPHRSNGNGVRNGMGPPVAGPAKPKAPEAQPGVGGRRDPLKRTLMRKTRVYEIDGKKVSSTTYHLLADDGISFKTKADHELRRAELQDIKRMQKEESRQLQEMSLHAQMMRDAAEKKAESERAAVMRTFDADLEALTRVQKRQLEETEKAQEEELKGAAKKAGLEKERDVKAFRDSLKAEYRVAKSEAELLPKAQRKEALRNRLRQLEVEHGRKEVDFEGTRAADIDAHLRRIQETKKAHVALMERQFLQQKHQLMRAKEAAQWELEEKQMKEGHQLDRQQMKDAFFLQRTLLLTKHAKELDQIKRFNAAKLDECQRAMAAERKRLPKVLRSETKTRSLMFKKQLRERLESLRISGATDGMEMSERIRAFEEQEKRRVAAELRKQEAKHKRKLDQIKAEQERSLREHEQVQNEKRRMLLEHEGRKLKEQELGYSEGLKAWKGNLKPRKTALEATFLKELESQEQFYAQDPTAALLHNAALAGSRGDLSAM